MSVFGLRRDVEGHLPAFSGATGWLNTPPLSPDDLRGKVVLVDFCTYTCINWLRTLPWIRAWEQKYRDHGLVVIGVHTPEFEFEHDLDNIRPAIEHRHIEYPIAIDNNYGVWRAFDNNYWPALYLADAEGALRYHHYGEGRYEESERTIQQLLEENGASDFDHELVSAVADGDEAQAAWEDLRSPETYLGYERTESFASPGGVARDRPHSYTRPEQLKRNQWSLSGGWLMQRGVVVSTEPGAGIAYRFQARDVNLVMGPQEPGARVAFRVSIDGDKPDESHGVDVDSDGNGVAREPRVYQLVRQSQDVDEHTFEITFTDGGMSAYSFTFG
jgi:thiol-disulfide isomerase/thioredoxin